MNFYKSDCEVEYIIYPDTLLGLLYGYLFVLIKKALQLHQRSSYADSMHFAFCDKGEKTKNTHVC